MSRYELRIGDYDLDSEDYKETITDFSELNITRNHTSMADWSVTVPGNRRYEDYVLERIYIWDTHGDDTDDKIFFVGVLEVITDNTVSEGTVKLSGRGRLVEETWASSVITYGPDFIHNIIDDFGTNTLDINTSIDTPDYYNTIEQGQTEREDVFVEAGKKKLVPSENSSAPFEVFRMGRTYDWTDEQVDSRITDETGDVEYLRSKDDFSLGRGIRLGGESKGTHSIEISNEGWGYTLENWELPISLDAETHPDEIKIYQNGTLIRSTTGSSDGWNEPIENWTNEDSIDSININFTLTIEIETSSTDQHLNIDVLAINDAEYSYTLPEELNENDVYDGPENYINEIYFDISTDDGPFDTQATGIVEFDDPHKDNEITFTEIDGRIASTSTTVTGDGFRWAQWGGERTNPTDDVRLRIYLSPQEDAAFERTGNYTFPVPQYHAIVPFSDDGIVFITDREFVGSDLEVFNEMHELSPWRYNTVYGSDTEIESFIIGTGMDVPDGFRKIDETQERDFSEYANKVTVDGSDDARATAESEAEQATVGDTIHRTFRRPDVETQIECKEQAKTLLQELAENRRESGSMTGVPTEMDVGYLYTFEEWQIAFDDSGQIEQGATLIRDGIDGHISPTDPDDEMLQAESSLDFIAEIVIWVPTNELESDEYVTVASSYHAHEFLRVYGDGSIGVENPEPGIDQEFFRTRSGLIENATSHRITLASWDTDATEPGNHVGEVYVDGGTMGYPDATYPVTSDIEYELGDFVLGSRWFHPRFAKDRLHSHWQFHPQDFDSMRADDTTLTGSSEDDLDISDGISVDTHGGRFRGHAVEFSDSHTGLTPVNEDGDPNTDFGTIDTGEAFTWTGWTRQTEFTNSYTFVSKGNPSSSSNNGYEFYADGGDLYLVVSGDGGQNILHIDGDYGWDIQDGEWHHLACTFTSGSNSDVFKIFLDGEQIDLLLSGDVGAINNTTQEWRIGSTDGVTEGGPYEGEMDDIRWYYDNALSDDEIKRLAEFEPGADPGFRGGIDDWRVWILNATVQSDCDSGADQLEQILNYPFEPATYGNDHLDCLRDGRETVNNSGLGVYWRFEEKQLEDDYDIQDDSANIVKREINGVLNNVTIERSQTTLDELSYNLSSDGGEMTLDFDIQQRIDVKLREAEKDVDNINQVL